MAAMTICPHCGGRNLGAKIKCHHCGRLLGRTPKAPQDPRGARLATVPSGVRAAEITIDTAGKNIIDVTRHVERFADEVAQSGVVNVFLPHATAGLALMEVGSGSEADLGEIVDRLFPSGHDYVHKHGRKGHGRDHVLPVFVSPSLMIPVDDGHLVLGQWQSIVIVDPNESNNQRRLRLSFLRGAL